MILAVTVDAADGQCTCNDFDDGRRRSQFEIIHRDRESDGRFEVSGREEFFVLCDAVGNRALESLMQFEEVGESSRLGRRRARRLARGGTNFGCLLYTSPSPRDLSTSRMPSSA